MEALKLHTDTNLQPSWNQGAFDNPARETPDAMTVFEFDDFRNYLNHVRINYPGLRRPITLERWAKKLNYRSPRSIAMVLKGQRLPSEDLVLAFSSDLNHSETERRYFELLVRKEKYRGNVPKAVAEELQKLNPKLIRRKAIDTEVFSYVSGWHHYVIRQLFSVPGFDGSAEWIAKRLGDKLTKEDIEASLNLLERLKLIERDAGSGKLRLASGSESLITMEDIPSTAVRKHHVEQMEQAKDALQRQQMTEREFNCLTLRVSRSKLPQIKKAIREFRDKFDKDFYEDDSKDVCQLNLQFFFHTVEEKK
ncbi:MAG: DUF4423 domain-containing protein [Bdellovibrionota bacterium]